MTDDITTTISPMLARVYADPDRCDWSAAYVQPKYDGHRCLATRHLLTSRGGNRITSCGHILAEINRLPAGRILDGELYLHGTPFNKISSLVRRSQLASSQLVYVVYDVVMDAPYRERLEWLRSHVVGLRHVQVAVTLPVSSPDELNAHYGEFLGAGYEGAILRHGNDGYATGKRSASLLKLKPQHDAEFRVVAVDEAGGSHAGEAVFTCETASGSTFRVLAPGSCEQRRRFWLTRDLWVGRMLTVKFSAWTEYGLPFHPIAKCFA